MKSINTLFRRVYADSLYRNSLYLIASNVVLSVFGFLFWLINARLFTPHQIGLATTLISVSGLIISLSLLGFNAATIRYLPTERNRNAFINTAFAVVSFGAVILTVGFLTGLPVFSPPLTFIRTSPLFMLSLVVFMIVATINAVTDSMFMALRSSHWIFFVNTLVASTKLLSPIFLLGLGTYGIFYSFVTAVNVGMVASVIILTARFGLRFLPIVRLSVFKRVWRFSFGTYLAGLFGMLNSTITPLLITNRLGPELTAYYYMPSMIYTMAASIPRSYASSFTAEGSHDGARIRSLFLRTLGSTYALLVPFVIGVLLFGHLVLAAFGKNYTAEGLVYMRLSIASLLLAVPNGLYGAVFVIRKRVDIILGVSVFSAILGLSLTYVSLSYGLTGLGWATIIGTGIVFLVQSVIVYLISGK